SYAVDALCYLRFGRSTVGDLAKSLPPGMSRYWAQRRPIVRCNMGIAMALPREMRPGAHVLSGGAVTYNDDAELVAALHRGDRAARTVLVQRYEPLVERLVAGALGIDSEISDVIQDVFVGV